MEKYYLCSALLCASAIYASEHGKIRMPRMFKGAEEVVEKQSKAQRIFDFPRKSVNLSLAARHSISHPHSLNGMQLLHSDEGFAVHSGDGLYKITPADMDANARRLIKENMAAFLQAGGVILITPTSDGSFIMRTSLGGKGGGWLGGQIGLWGTRMVGWGVALLAANYATKKTAEVVNNGLSHVSPKLVDRNTYTGRTTSVIINRGLGLAFTGIPTNPSDIVQATPRVINGMGVAGEILGEDMQYELGRRCLKPYIFSGVSNLHGREILINMGRTAVITNTVMPEGVKLAAKITAPVNAYFDGVETVAKAAQKAGEACPIL